MNNSDPQKNKDTMSIKGEEVIKVKQAVMSQEKMNSNKILTTNVKEPLKETSSYHIFFSRIKTLLLY